MLFTVRHILQIKGSDIWSISPKATVYDALRMMSDKDIGALLVMEGDTLVGILSERDYARKIILHGKSSRETTVREIMSPVEFTIHPEQTIDECMDLMTRKRLRYLPVMEGDHLLGVISIGDVVYGIITKQRRTIREYESSKPGDREG
ncbi:MAG TPA: CBS domain-containing protein [Anaerolineaceae bacterium]|nr:CBS domain-containing protein [Anaerolineaceae bacterium]